LVVEGVIAPGGRLVTEDRGSLDADGRVIVSGRGSDLIISGGENVDPMRIKQALNDHPAVTDAAVVARTDTEWGQRPVAFVVGTPDGSLNEMASSRTGPARTAG
jgi:O-succinylbenzoic acid--CoA ligase